MEKMNSQRREYSIYVFCDGYDDNNMHNGTHTLVHTKHANNWLMCHL